MTAGVAKDQLKRTGQVIYQGWDIWETVKDGEYTGRYRIAPAGQREQYEECGSIPEAFRKAKRRFAKVAVTS